MLDERDIEALAAEVVGGAQEAFVAGLTAALVDDLAAGFAGAAARSTLSALAAANRKHVGTLLMEHRARISDTAYRAALRTLEAADERDARAVAAFRHASPEAATAHARMMAEQAAIGIREMVERQNVALAAQAERAWYDVAAEGIRYAEAGAMPKGWMDGAVLRLAKAGIETVDYRSGVSNQIDVAIKRHMRTQVNQAAGRMEIDRLDACGHRFVQTTAHFGARDDHEPWQGKAFCLDGPCDVNGIHYPDFYAATGYGTVTGLCGANCRHHFGIHVPGLSRLPELPEEVRGMGPDEYYAATQRQRELERRVRKTKRDVAALEQAGIGLESGSYVQKRLVLGRQQKALREHCAETGLARQDARERAYGVAAQPRALTSSAAKTYVSQMRGRTNVKVDRFVPCLLDTKTGELVDTEVCRFTARSQLKGYNSKTGWDINWQKVPKEVDVYGLSIKGQVELQGLVALRADEGAQAVYLHYAKTAPRNDKHATGRQDYEGVGGHLFALAVEVSEKAGFGGYLYGFAEDAKLERHYIEKLGAMHVGALHPFHFAVDEAAAKRLLEEYNYEWK